MKKTATHWLLGTASVLTLFGASIEIQAKQHISKDNFSIVIDPGHGGVFSGCQGSKTQESVLVLDIAQRLTELLHKKGFKATLTRQQEKELDPDLMTDLHKRIEFTEQNNAQVFISIHLNSSSNKQARGYEVYVPYNEKLSYLSYELAIQIHHALAHAIEQEWTGTLGNLNSIDRGIREAKFTVLTQEQCPACILIELDYLTNKKSEKLLQDPGYRQKLAGIIQEGIVTYYNLLPAIQNRTPHYQKKTNVVRKEKKGHYEQESAFSDLYSLY
jgi:N-acetylmuramoyl-L-alanine amidase